MTQMDFEHERGSLQDTRLQVRQAGYVHHAQMMLVAASLAAAGIVAVAATMMTTLL
tara:strand:- start:1713 stop:1880 length:168 start_codon:yes stop_codon:yes gene_type:complete